MSKRFWVFENDVTIDASVKRASLNEDKDYKQEIKFTVKANSYKITDPFSNMKVVITQNGRIDNALRNIQPEVVNGGLFNYDVNNDVTFNGGNEFRDFDIKTLKSNSVRIKKISIDSATQKDYVTLLNDERRTVKQYLTYKDINGRFLIKSEDHATDSHTEGDYAYVHFTLPYNAPVTDGDLYILGQLTDWRFSKDSKMIFNYQKKAYEATLYVKQGFYDYEYVFLPKGGTVGDETLIEGNHYETENEYTIFIYNREEGTTFDKLIGLKQLNTIFN